MTETIMILVSLYAGYKLFSKSGEKFFYKD